MTTPSLLPSILARGWLLLQLVPGSAWLEAADAPDGRPGVSLGPAPGTAVQVTADTVTLNDRNLTVRLNRSDATWEAIWSADVGAGLSRVGFSVQVDGKEHATGAPTTVSGPSSIPSSDAAELATRWEADGIRVERELRVDAAAGGLLLGGRIVNQSDRPVQLGTTRLLAVAREGGWWVGKRDALPGAVQIYDRFHRGGRW